MAIASQSKTPIVVNGGGIAGLTAALCLADEGFVVELHEKAERFETVGAGIQISPNAYQVMEKLRLGRQIRKTGMVPDFISVRKARNGKEIKQIPLGLSAIRRFGYPYVVIHRADLQDILYQKCVESTRIRMHFGSELVDYAAHENGITTAVFQEGDIYEGRALAVVLADGVHSKLRQKIMEAEPASFQGRIAWRALIRGEQVPKEIPIDNTALWLAPGNHAVTYPVRDGKFLNVVAITHSEDPSKAEVTDKVEIAKNFRRWAPEFQALFETDARWSGWPLYECPLPEKLAKGPVAMIGDAAHAMMPFAAQGAAMAIEDAALLAKLCASVGDFPKAFRQFESERIPRLRDIMRTSQKNGRIYHLGWPQSVARNLVMKMSSPTSLLSRQDWIYKWRP